MTTPESFRETWRNIATTFFKLGLTSYSGPAIWTQTPCCYFHCSFGSTTHAPPTQAVTQIDSQIRCCRRYPGVEYPCRLKA